MRIIDPIAQKEIEVVQVYLTAVEALQIKQQLEKLLQDTEASEHFHDCRDDNRDLSFSIVTPTKLSCGDYSELEQVVLQGICDG